MRALRALGRWVTALLLLAAGGRRTTEERVLPPAPAGRRAGAVVAALLGGATLGSAAFIVAYLLDASTQVLGVALGGAFACLSAAAVVAAKRLVPQEKRAEPLGDTEHPDEQQRAAQIVREGTEGVSRRRLLLAAAGGTACVTGAALALPAASLGPVLGTERLRQAPWRPGRRVVDEHGRPLLADELEVGSFTAGFAEGVEHARLDASLVVVRMEPGDLRLPPARAGWAVDGIVAYSRICTHAACAITLYESPRYEPTSPRPRLVCPCHYSVFDATAGGGVLGGPAGRPLPQLPLARDGSGALVAAGGLSAPPGPSWGRVRP
jgi:ubiquinol-cytochrome c reductase iron-sulfur subunit